MELLSQQKELATLEKLLKKITFWLFLEVWNVLAPKKCSGIGLFDRQTSLNTWVAENSAFKRGQSDINWPPDFSLTNGRAQPSWKTQRVLFTFCPLQRRALWVVNVHSWGYLNLPDGDSNLIPTPLRNFVADVSRQDANEMLQAAFALHTLFLCFDRFAFVTKIYLALFSSKDFSLILSTFMFLQKKTIMYFALFHPHLGQSPSPSWKRIWILKIQERFFNVQKIYILNTNEIQFSFYKNE